MTFWKTVGAYLVGWVIAQSIFNRVRHHIWDRDGYDVKDEIATFVAERLINQLESRDKELAALRALGAVVRQCPEGPVLSPWLARLRAAHEKVSVARVCSADA